jgi:hypothetical protein
LSRQSIHSDFWNAESAQVSFLYACSFDMADSWASSGQYDGQLVLRYTLGKDLNDST